MTTTSMVDVYELDHEEFVQWLDTLTTPQAVYKFAGDIYGYLSGLFHQSCNDSVLREWAFDWASQGLGIKYEDIYDRWLA